MKTAFVLLALLEFAALAADNVVPVTAPALSGISPLELQIRSRKRIGYWTFDSPDFASHSGAKPMLATNAGLVTGLNGPAADIAGPSPSILQYRTMEGDGSPNIDLREGTIRLYLRPAWSSQLRGGQGPGSFARVFEAGSWSSQMTGYWGVNFTPDGNTVTFGGQDNGKGGAFLTMNFHHLQGLVSNRWCYMEVTYSPQASRIVVKSYDAPPADQSGAPAIFHPSLEVCKNLGMRFGSDIAGGNRIEAAMDDIEIFNYVIGEVEREQRLAGNVFYLESEGPGPTLNLRWKPGYPGVNIDVKRRRDGQTAVITLTNTIAHQFKDNHGLEYGSRYYYSAGRQLLTAGLRLPPSEYRGKVMLLVDRTQMKTATMKLLSQLRQDLVGDGWTPIVLPVARHNDKDWRANPPVIDLIKSTIVSNYVQSAGDLKAVFLIGHVPAPYSGVKAPDSHAEHRGAWPTDAFYGDMDGVWTDITANHTHPKNSVYSNIPGDGKFDQNGIPENKQGRPALEIAVGRVDFSRMPAFEGMSENELLNRYLEKDHRYRMGGIRVPERVVAGSFFGNQFDDSIYRNALINESRLFKHEPGHVVQGNILTDNLGCVFGVLGAYGSGGAILSGAVTTVSLARRINEPPVLFYILKGSYFGDIFFSDDNFLRGVTGGANFGLASLWTMEQDYNLNGLALGDTLGESLRAALNDNIAKYDNQNFTCLVGDPTLRLHILSPPSNLQARKAGASAELTWMPSSDSGAQYYVYRSSTTNSAFTRRLTPVPIAGARFIDENPIKSEKFYMVRALKLKSSGSGSYTNLSQGVFTNLK